MFSVDWPTATFLMVLVICLTTLTIIVVRRIIR